MKISFITDEVTQSFDEAVRFARQNGLAGLELRSVEDTAIDMLPAETLRTWRRRLDAEGLTVCGLAGSFYKCAPEPDAVEAELAKLERLCAAADILGCAFSAVVAKPLFGPPTSGRQGPYGTSIRSLSPQDIRLAPCRWFRRSAASTHWLRPAA